MMYLSTYSGSGKRLIGKKRIYTSATNLLRKSKKKKSEVIKMRFEGVEREEKLPVGVAAIT